MCSSHALLMKHWNRMCHSAEVIFTSPFIQGTVKCPILDFLINQPNACHIWGFVFGFYKSYWMTGNLRTILEMAVDYICFIDNGLENLEVIFPKRAFNRAKLYLIMFDKEVLYSTLRKAFTMIILYWIVFACAGWLSESTVRTKNILKFGISWQNESIF